MIGEQVVILAVLLLRTQLMPSASVWFSLHGLREPR